MAKSKNKTEMTPLGPDYEPTPTDVVCARGKIAVGHIGNKRFKNVVAEELQRYSDAPSKLAKSAIVSDIVDSIRKSSAGAGFVKKIDDQWYIATDHLAREKVGQCLRDLLHSKYRSSTKAKKLSRKVKQSMLDDEVDQIMSRGTNRDITERVKELTKGARRDSDYQKAFNKANLELLKTFKTEPRCTEEDDDDEESHHDNDEAHSESPNLVSSSL